jgi:hypothetical protein
MKKIIFYILIIISIILLINIVNILSTDFDRLTKYGFGYLAGKIILFIVFVLISFFTKKAIYTKKTK